MNQAMTLEQRNSALCRAVRRGYLKRVKQLLRDGGDPNSCMWVRFDREREDLEAYLVIVAMYFEHDDVVEALIDAGADVSVQFPSTCDPLIHEAAWRRGTKHLTQIIARGGDVNTRGRHGRTALMGCALDAVPVLVAAGADLEARDDMGNTALMHAVRWPRTDVVRALIEAGADLGRGMRTGTPLVRLPGWRATR